jgi:hypothetical protein
VHSSYTDADLGGPNLWELLVPDAANNLVLDKGQIQGATPSASDITPAYTLRVLCRWHSDEAHREGDLARLS